MPISAKSTRIGGASLIAVLMVAGGYVLPGYQFPETKPVNAELTDDILASYVSRDTDADGLPDWQEILYGTDANVADTDGDGVSDGEAVRRGLLTPTTLSSQLPEDPIGEEDIPGETPAPGSLTERFSRTFFEAYMKQSNGQPMDAAAQDALVNSLLAEFTRDAAQSLTSSYTRVSVHTDPNVTVSAYVSGVEQILAVNLPNTSTQNAGMFTLSERLVQQNDEAAGKRLAELGDQYLTASRSILELRVPPSLADNHLRLVQGLEEAGRSAKAISAYQSDPFLTMGGLAVLAPSRTKILEALNGIAVAVLSTGEPAFGAPGALIVETVRYSQRTQ